MPHYAFTLLCPSCCCCCLLMQQQYWASYFVPFLLSLLSTTSFSVCFPRQLWHLFLSFNPSLRVNLPLPSPLLQCSTYISIWEALWLLSSVPAPSHRTPFKETIHDWSIRYLCLFLFLVLYVTFLYFYDTNRHQFLDQMVYQQYHQNSILPSHLWTATFLIVCPFVQLVLMIFPLLVKWLQGLNRA